MEKYFQHHQKLLVRLINDGEIRFLLGIRQTGKIVKITPHSYHVLQSIGKKNIELEAICYPTSFFGKNFWPLVEKYHIAGNFHSLLSFSTLVANPNTGGGRILNQNQGTWAAARGNGSGTLTDGSYDIGSDTNFTVRRSFMPFVTSSLGSTAIVSAAVVNYFRDDSFEGGVFNADGTTIEIVPQTQASDTSLALSDFSQITFTSKGSLAFSSTTNSQFNNITLTDVTVISLTGDTKLAAITGRDLNNAQPTGVNILGSNTAPTLTITYTLPGQGRDVGYSFFL